MTALRTFVRWLDRQTRVNEDEPTWTQTAVIGVGFLLALAALCADLFLVGAAVGAR